MTKQLRISLWLLIPLFVLVSCKSDVEDDELFAEDLLPRTEDHFDFDPFPIEELEIPEEQPPSLCGWDLKQEVELLTAGEESPIVINQARQYTTFLDEGNALRGLIYPDIGEGMRTRNFNAGYLWHVKVLANQSGDLGIGLTTEYDLKEIEKLKSSSDPLRPWHWGMIQFGWGCVWQGNGWYNCGIDNYNQIPVNEFENGDVVSIFYNLPYKRIHWALNGEWTNEGRGIELPYRNDVNIFPAVYIGRGDTVQTSCIRVIK